MHRHHDRKKITNFWEAVLQKTPHCSSLSYPGNWAEGKYTEDNRLKQMKRKGNVK
jgi:hypothetical protein